MHGGVMWIYQTAVTAIVVPDPGQEQHFVWRCSSR
jgi:hypothetical protein